MTNADIINAASRLASVCDGAVKDDGTGYNGRDAPFIHSVFGQEFPPTPKQIAAIYKILRTYRTQLSGFGINYDNLVLDPIETAPVMSVSGKSLFHDSWNDKTIGFGKHKGKSYGQVYKDDYPYLEWLAKESYFDDVKEIANKILKGEPLENDKIVFDCKDGEVVITSPFAAKDLCSGLSIREWDGEHWICPAMIIEELIETFKLEVYGTQTLTGFDVQMTPAFETERDRIAILRETSNAVDSDFEMGEEFGGEKILYPYQLVGAKFIEMSNGCSMINDTVGLGKSAQALSYVYNHSAMRPVIIICPASVKYQWDGYCREWIPDSNPEVINGTKGEFAGDIIILNYDILKKNLNILKSINPQILILDESHKIKNYQSQRTIAAVDLASQIPHRMLLSGTPALNRTSELWMPLTIVRPDIYNRMTFTKWHKKYCDAKKTEYGWDYSGNSNTGELAEELKFIMLRRTEEEVFDELPEMIRSNVPVSITNRKTYNTARDNYLAWVRDQRGLKAAQRASRAEHLSRIAALKRLAAEGKLESAISWIKDYLESEEKIVVFAHHKSIIAKLAEEFGDECVVIDGSTPQKDRIPITNKFESDPKLKILIGNLKAASEGLNLGISKTVVHLELDWSPKTHEQCEGRIRGLRQIGRGRKTTHSIYILGIDTIDIEIIEMLEAKRKVIDTTFDDNTKLDFDFLAGLVNHD